MRENIGLYRGKRIDNDECVEGWLIIKKDPVLEITYCFILVYGEGESFVAWYLVDPETVGECTGRKDKNGKCVFEGDILRLFTIWEDGTAEPVDVPVIVQFCENDQCYVLTTKQGSHYDDFGNYGRPEYYEIIGNIHDNPELLEEGQIKVV